MIDVPVVVSSSQGLHGEPGFFPVAAPKFGEDELMPLYQPMTPEAKYAEPVYWNSPPPPEALDIFMRTPPKTRLQKYHSPPTKAPPAKRRLKLV